MKNAVMWDVTPLALVRTDDSEYHIATIFRVEENRARNDVSSN
jgi:hypothetical protein